MNTDESSVDVALAQVPATRKQIRLVFAVGLLLLSVVVVTAPIANTHLARIPAFLPSIQAIIFVDDFITSILLFAQCAILPTLAVLILGGGYLFTALIVVAQTLAFPDAFVPGHLIGGLQTASYLYIFWHSVQPMAIIAYAYYKTGRNRVYEGKTSVNRMIALSVAVATGLAAMFTLISIGLQNYLPPMQQDTLNFTAPHALLAFGVFLSLSALCTLWTCRKTLLDYWLMLVVWTLLLEELLFNLFTEVRYGIGFYTGRMLLLATSIFVLALLLAETIFLASRLARQTMILQRERENKLTNMGALAASISHELKQPLTAITMNGAAVLQLLKNTPPDLNELRLAASEIVEGGCRSGQIVDNLRILFSKATHQEETLDINEVVQKALSALHGELMRYNVVSRTALAPRIPPIPGHRSQLEEVVVNLCSNSIEAMSNVPAGSRSLTIRTLDENGAAAIVEVEDTGPGVDPATSARIFDAFFTTKAGGMGLGLALSRMIVERHNGRLSLVPAVSEGSIFRVELPTLPTSVNKFSKLTND
ncbi:MAG: MASE4 domain-containing protein [Acidobacteriaceae bacterium]|nr:MASE4 domain-containing protein [Acidobacteriaceae bacterium]